MVVQKYAKGRVNRLKAVKQHVVTIPVGMYIIFVNNMFTRSSGPSQYSIMYNIGRISGKSVLNGVWVQAITP